MKRLLTANELLVCLASGNAKATKLVLGFKSDIGKCKSCECFLWTPVGELNRCVLGGFTCSSKHGCNAYRRGKPLHKGKEFSPRRQMNGQTEHCVIDREQ